MPEALRARTDLVITAARLRASAERWIEVALMRFLASVE